jgi:pyruvate/2-oxoglutarate dehydrogenase complex dihydrolipoamide acyltransferase (E2) component
MMIITLSCDHRVIDGARAARFLEALVDLIEELRLMRRGSIGH